MPRTRLAAVLLPLAVAACARTGPDAVVVVDIPAAAPAPAEEAPPARHPPSGPGLVGHWEGVGRQKSGSSWQMIVDIESVGPGRCARVSYPTVPCAADWICAEAPTDGALRAREHLTDGIENCIDDGDVVMSVSRGGLLEWRWKARDGSGETAEAHLTRR